MIKIITFVVFPISSQFKLFVMFKILLKAENSFIIPFLMDMLSNWQSFPKISENFSENSATLKVISIFKKTHAANDVNWEDYFYEYILNKLPAAYSP